MNHRESTYSETPGASFTLHDNSRGVDADAILEDILAGLTAGGKYISCVHFYDAAGSRLFEEITQLPEYYLTRIEKDLLKKAALQIGSGLDHTDIIELGSGDCSKISILLNSVSPEALESVRYIPVDISRTAIEESADTLIESFPGLEVHGVVADFTKQFPPIPGDARRLFCFLGSTIGNFTEVQGISFLRNLRRVMRSGDTLLVGFDMVKDRETIEPAYNDRRGVTAAFNRNILNVVNTIAGTDFNPEAFEHVAFFNEEHSRIEMHLKAVADLEISCPHLQRKIFVARGETIHTENSHKYTEERIHDLASGAGLEIKDRFMDENGWYSLVQFRGTGTPDA